MPSGFLKCVRDHPITLSFVISCPLLPLVTSVWGLGQVGRHSYHPHLDHMSRTTNLSIEYQLPGAPHPLATNGLIGTNSPGLHHRRISSPAGSVSRYLTCSYGQITVQSVDARAAREPSSHRQRLAVLTCADDTPHWLQGRVNRPETREENAKLF